jgi:BatD DUF11 like domain
MKSHTAFQRHLLAGVCAASILAAPAWAAPNQISAQLDRLTLSIGDSAQLAITVKGSPSAEPSVPMVDGLEITPVGQQSSMQVINGAVSAEVRYVYQVTPNRVGSFTIPAIGQAGGGSTQPIAFRVERVPSGQNARTSGPGNSSLPAPRVTQAQDDSGSADFKGQPAFLRVVLPKRELTVGELVPVELKACFPAGMSASLNGLPMLTGGAFALNKLGENPEQTREIIDGRPYNVITWSSALSAIQAGDYPMNLELPVMVRVQEKGKRGGHNPVKDFFGDELPFDDSVLDDFFGQVTEKPLALHSDGTLVKIQPLPLQGRPADFSGAVGKFDVSAEASVARAVTGDPITLKMKIIGQGNFDRVTTNGLASSAAWKGYQPNARFEPSDSDGFTGTKTFEQAIVPRQSGSTEIPAVSFSYFDPETRSYVTKTTGPIPIEVAPGSTTVSSVPAKAPTTTPATTPSTDGLVPDHRESGPTSSLRPVVLAPWFLIGNAFMVAATSVGLLTSRWRQRRANDPERVRADAARAAVREAVSAMDEAIKNQNGVGFFHSARKAVTERLAERWSMPASRVTPAEIQARLNSGGEKICALFKRGDEVVYSREKVAVSELTQWRAEIAQQLAHI